MDGYVTIGTKLKTDEFDMKYKKLENDIEKKEINVQIKVDKANQTQKELENIKQDIKDTEKELNKISKDAERYAYLNSKVPSQLPQEEAFELWSLEGIDKEEAKIVDKLAKLNLEQSELNTKLKKENDEISEANFKLEEAKNKATKFKEQVEKTRFDKVKNSINGVNNAMSSVIKKVGRWALAIFGIRSAYMLIRQAMSTLSEYNDDMANKISNIRLVLATALEPIVNRILSIVITLLSYLNYITKAFFGLDLFARAGELTTNKMAKDMASGAKSAKEMKKQLAGFDEMNVLNDNSSAGGGGGGGKIKTPEFNLPEAEIPDWLKWIVDNKDIILSVIAGITAGLLAWKLGLGALKSLGIGLLVAGLVYAIQNLIKYLKDPTFENFGKVITGIGIALLGLAVIIGNVPLAIIAAAVLIGGIIITYWDKIKKFFEEKILGWFANKKETVKQKYGSFWLSLFVTAENFLKMIMNIFDGQIKSLKEVFDGIILFIKGVFTADWKMALEGLKKIFSGVFNGLKSIVVNVWNFIKSTVYNMAVGTANAFKGVINTAINGLFGLIENFINSFIRDINNVIKLINVIPGVNLRKLNYLHITRLAKGGIINQPGSGVPVGGAVAGERGQEGVIPLTDSQQMALLGQAIGKYITINANITNSMNGRVISRELQKIQNESNFAFNS